MDFQNNWFNIIRNCSFDNTYKMAWSKAITELALEFDFENNENEIVPITLEAIAQKVVRYYWDQTIFFDLRQGSNPTKPPEIVSKTKKLIEVYQAATGNKKPIKFIKADVEDICSNDYLRTIKSIVSTLKQDVSYRFLNLAGKQIQGIYEYQLKDNVLYMPKENLFKLKENYAMMVEAINYRWSQILENFNHSPRICKKVRVIDEENIRRKPLKGFSKYLTHENPGQVCFICEKVISGETPALDHVLPWSYLYSDDLWNLVYAHQSCNSTKSNVIPNEEMIHRLEQRNVKLLQILEKQNIQDKHVSELRLATEIDLVKKFWIACQG
ncbi:HNH endonuclease [Brevibacillus reuszeri]|uniref:HNH endonuclease n=1 Tax=Brevibacillus reuszeri TaxID=54915 RepID=UPI003D242946